MSERVLIIGGSNLDITAKIGAETVPNDSNPARITTACGGVGRNIAENAARMGLETSFLTVLGTDPFSQMLRASCVSCGVDMSESLTLPETGCGMYLSVVEQSGELALSACDLDAMEKVPAKRYEEKREFIGSFPIVLIDANHTEEVLKTVAPMVRGLLFADAVSVKKAVRLKPVLPFIHTLKVNRSELESISGMPAGDRDSIRKAAEAVLGNGTKRVLVTCGKEGCCCFTEKEALYLPAFDTEVKNVTGAGDAFTAAVLYGTAAGWSGQDLLLLGTAASHIALESPSAVSEKMSADLLREKYCSLMKRRESSQIYS